MIPLTLVQVDVEKMKKSVKEVPLLFRKIVILVLTASLFLLVFYKYFTAWYFTKFAGTFGLFLIILVAKVFQAFSPVFGTYMAIKRQYTLNLKINLFVLALNIILSYLLFNRFGLYGVAYASLLSLLIRFIILRKIVKTKYL